MNMILADRAFRKRLIPINVLAAFKHIIGPLDERPFMVQERKKS